MYPVHLTDHGVPRNKLEDRTGWFISRRLGGLGRYGSSNSDPQTPQIPVPVENLKEEVHPAFTLGRDWGNLKKYMFQRDIFQGPYGNNQRLESQQAVQALRRERSQ
ncbi:hypothetical protein O181_046646 [Austropuccinia psidii MF-1]|uniref:Uncharacterized protein n=1 Tax=Austropuccinia psidii MF-1 TaxID=1389203 RepID=A0A9Q3DUL4_9BASI|nr:hypothetical protein [Austropuccinia psidii MF-1]